jgi:DNA-binding winged helix-turn-helix (wHTH) protein
MNTEPGSHIVFGPFRLDLIEAQLWRGEQTVALQPKPLAVLQYLAQRPGQVVSKRELLKAVWDTIVGTAVVKECLRAIRGALGEDMNAPQYIETVGREGYRFLAPSTSTTTPVSSSRFQVSSSETQHSVLVGREAELTRLHAALRKALNGERQLVFVTGEPGIGKTTLVETFLAEVGAATANASNNTAAGKPISPSWRRWGVSAEKQMGNPSRRRSGSMRPRG